MRIVKIEDEAAIEEIRRAVNSPDVRTLRVSAGNNGVKFKVNSGIWSPPYGAVEGVQKLNGGTQ